MAERNTSPTGTPNGGLWQISIDLPAGRQGILSLMGHLKTGNDSSKK